MPCCLLLILMQTHESLPYNTRLWKYMGFNVLVMYMYMYNCPPKQSWPVLNHRVRKDSVDGSNRNHGYKIYWASRIEAVIMQVLKGFQNGVIPFPQWDYFESTAFVSCQSIVVSNLIMPVRNLVDIEYLCEASNFPSCNARVRSPNKALLNCFVHL